MVALPVVMLAVSLGVFLLAAASPFEPLVGYLGDRYLTMSQQDQARIAEQLGMNQPWPAQYLQWLGHLIQGDLGTSRVFGRPVSEVLAQRLPWTLLLSGVAMVMALVASLILATWAARRQNGLVDRVVTGMATLVQGVPPFVVALVFVTVLGVALQVLPVGGLTDPGAEVTPAGVARHLVQPALVLAVSQMPWLVLHLRQSLLAALSEDHVRGARARGIGEWTVLLRHALPTALLPFATVAGSRVAELVAGTVIVEEVFSWPGVAQAVVASAMEVDFPLLAALALLATVAVLLGSLLADVSYAALDPRVGTDG